MNFVNCVQTFRLLPLARASQISDKEPATPTIIESAEVKRQKEYELTDLYGTKDAKKKVCFFPMNMFPAVSLLHSSLASAIHVL